MTDTRPTNRLQAGDRFHFAKGTSLEILDSQRGILRRDIEEWEHFIVLRAGPGRTYDPADGPDDYAVWAVAIGTPLDEVHNRTVLFYQEGPYVPRAIVETVLVEAAKQRTQYASAKRAA